MWYHVCQSHGLRVSWKRRASERSTCLEHASPFKMYPCLAGTYLQGTETSTRPDCIYSNGWGSRALATCCCAAIVRTDVVRRLASKF